MKCTRCKQPARIKLESHNAKFCDDCYQLFFLNAVRKAFKLFDLDRKKKICVAVSGGKDSLAAWEALHLLGRRPLGIHIDLGIPEFSEASIAAIDEFAASRGLEWRLFELKKLFGYAIPEIDRRTPRIETCALCGSLKRSFLNRLAVEAGAGYLATGHHLDDEAARLLGNILRHKHQYLDKFYPYLPSVHPAQAGRIKPLFRLDEEEIRAFIRVRGIVPVQGPACPFHRGATSHYFRDAVNFLEGKMPGTKRDFVFTWLKGKQPPEAETFASCTVCGQPTYGQVCSICRLKGRLDRWEERGPSR